MKTQTTLTERLQAEFTPDYLSVLNESYMHNVPEGSESHFKVVLVSSAFIDCRKVARHQRVYALVGDLLAGALHALALHIYTPDEWQAINGAPASPACHGGGD